MTRREQLRERARIGREKAVARFHKANEATRLHAEITKVAIRFVDGAANIDDLIEAVAAHRKAFGEWQAMSEEAAG